jgi:hypothetical protein
MVEHGQVEQCKWKIEERTRQDLMKNISVYFHKLTYL